MMRSRWTVLKVFMKIGGLHLGVRVSGALIRLAHLNGIAIIGMKNLGDKNAK